MLQSWTIMGRSAIYHKLCMHNGSPGAMQDPHPLPPCTPLALNRHTCWPQRRCSCSGRSPPPGIVAARNRRQGRRVSFPMGAALVRLGSNRAELSTGSPAVQSSFLLGPFPGNPCSSNKLVFHLADAPIARADRRVADAAAVAQGASGAVWLARPAITHCSTGAKHQLEQHILVWAAMPPLEGCRLSEFSGGHRQAPHMAPHTHLVQRRDRHRSHRRCSSRTASAGSNGSRDRVSSIHASSKHTGEYLRHAQSAPGEGKHVR